MCRHTRFIAPSMFSLGLLLACASSVLAQFPEHRLQSVYPMGGKSGETIEVTVIGADLEGLDGLRFDHPGLRAFLVKGPTFRIAIAPDVPIGPHQVRLSGRFGLSNPRTFVIGDAPEVVEKEPNNELKDANPWPRSSVFNGRMDNSPDVDCLAFDGKAGERIFLELAAERLDSRLVGVIQLLDSTGHEIAASANDSAGDPCLDVTLPADGKYIVKIHDLIYGGSTDHGYRLSLKTGPQLDAVEPAVVVAGNPAALTLIGRNLAGQPFPGVTIEGRPLERLPVTANFLATTLGIGIESRRSPVEALGDVWSYKTETKGGRSNSVALSTSALPIFAEVEPNAPDKPQAVTLPCAIAGAFVTRGDQDVYRFTAKQGDVWWVDAWAERIGSPADPEFVIQKVSDKGEVTDLASADDAPGLIPGLLLGGNSVDAKVRWVVPENGTYQVTINDLYLSQRGDPRLNYRLDIRPERPDFRLFVRSADTGNQPGGVTLRAGGRTAIPIFVERIDGFAGPIEIETRDLPAGITAEKALIGTGQNQSFIVLTAAAGTTNGEFMLRLFGQSRSADRKELLTFLPATSRPLVELEHEAMPITSVHPPQTVNGAIIPELRLMEGFPVAIREAAPFLLTAQPSQIVLGPGESADVTVSLVRGAGFTEAVALTLAEGLPANLAAVNGTIAKEATSAVLKITVPANVPPGVYSILPRGTGPVPFNKDPNAKEKPNLNVTEPANAITLTVRRP